MKANKQKKPAQVFHFDLYGKREFKYDFLQNNNLQSVKWQELEFNDENYFFVPKDFSQKAEYDKGFKVDELFIINTSGIKTHDDNNLVSFNPFDEHNQKYDYRPFDTRYICYDLKKVLRHRITVMKHFVDKENLGLTTCRQQSTFNFQHVFITKYISDMCSVSMQTKETGYIFPLYLYDDEENLSTNHTNQHEPEETKIDLKQQVRDVREAACCRQVRGKKIKENSVSSVPLCEIQSRIPNLNPKIIKGFEQKLNMTFTPEALKQETLTAEPRTLYPIQIFDYIYAVLHSPSYREKYKEFLKIDFPRVPYPNNEKQFLKLVELGRRLRCLHLLENVKIEKGLASYPVDGKNEVTKIQFTDSKVYINETQYFDNVPVEAWDFYIGGYQPAQKWLKDRKGRALNFEDILHYQKIIHVLKETGEIMVEIDVVDDEG